MSEADEDSLLVGLNKVTLTGHRRLQAL